MSILVDRKSKVVVQGITGRDGSFHTQQMIEYGTRVVAGVTPGKAGETLHGVPVFNTVAEACQATSANTSVIYVPPAFAADAIYEAADAGVDLVLLVNTYHHIDDRPAYFRRLRGDLRPGGRVAVIEPNQELGGVLSLALDEGHTSRASEVEAEMLEAGYAVAARHEFLPVQIFRVFAPGDASR